MNTEIKYEYKEYGNQHMVTNGIVTKHYSGTAFTKEQAIENFTDSLIENK